MSENELPTFKAWLMASKDEDCLKPYEEYLLKTRLDHEFPADYVTFADIADYLAGKDAQDKSKGIMFVLWTCYIRANFEAVTLREIAQYVEQALAMIKGNYVDSGTERDLVEATVSDIEKLGNMAGTGFDLAKGIDW